MIRPKVQILLSTYNGEQYIAEQLDSILAQEGVDFHILVRDDGSRDRTTEIVERYTIRYPEIIFLQQSENKRLPASFFELICSSDNQADYYAFCDQDDVWEPCKLLRAVTMLQALESQEQPLLYCSATSMVDEEMSEIAIWPTKPQRQLTLYNALVENVVVGCTVVVNNRAMSLVKCNLPQSYEHVIMHDWWMFLCVSAFGKVVFDEEPSIRYRQHEGNALGGADRGYSKWKKRIMRFARGQNYYILSHQASEFLNCFRNKLDSKQRADIEQFVTVQRKNLVIRICYTFRSPFYRQSYIDNMLYKLISVLGKV